MNIIKEEHVPYNTGWAGEMKKEQVIRITATKFNFQHASHTNSFLVRISSHFDADVAERSVRFLR